MSNLHLLNRYDRLVQTVADSVFAEFGVTLNERERGEIRDEIYRQANNAKVREDAV